MLLTSCPTMSSETRTLPHRLIISRAFRLVDDSHTRVACKKHGQSSDSASVELASMLFVNRGSLSGHSSGCKSALPNVALKSQIISALDLANVVRRENQFKVQSSCKPPEKLNTSRGVLLEKDMINVLLVAPLTAVNSCDLWKDRGNIYRSANPE